MAFLRGDNGLLILGERQSDQFLQLSVYYLLPFDLFLSEVKGNLMFPAQASWLHSILDFTVLYAVYRHICNYYALM